MNADSCISVPASESSTDPDEPGSYTDSEADDPEPPARSRKQEDQIARTIEIRVERSVRQRIDAPLMESHLSRLPEHLHAPVAHVDVVIVNDELMCRFHRDHLGIDETTDVLTFDSSAESRAIRADIVVCADEAQRQAERRGHSIENELLLYIMHGVLHCAGFDDYADAEYDSMHAEEDRLLSLIDVGPVFESRAQSNGRCQEAVS